MADKPVNSFSILECFDHPEKEKRASVRLTFTACQLLLQGAVSGVVRGAGLQRLGAINMFVSLYCIGMPLGAYLLFLSTLRLKGTFFCSKSIFSQKKQATTLSTPFNQ